jgi:hypothetical protein
MSSVGLAWVGCQFISRRVSVLEAGWSTAKMVHSRRRRGLAHREVSGLGGDQGTPVRHLSRTP